MCIRGTKKNAHDKSGMIYSYLMILEVFFGDGIGIKTKIEAHSTTIGECGEGMSWKMPFFLAIHMP